MPLDTSPATLFDQVLHAAVLSGLQHLQDMYLLYATCVLSSVCLCVQDGGMPVGKGGLITDESSSKSPSIKAARCPRSHGYHHDSAASYAADSPAHDSAGSYQGKAFREWVRSDKTFNEGDSSLEEFVQKNCQDTPMDSIAPADLDLWLSSCRPPEAVAQQPFKPFDAYANGPPKPVCHEERTWTADGIYKLKATRDGDIGMCMLGKMGMDSSVCL